MDNNDIHNYLCNYQQLMCKSNSKSKKAELKLYTLKMTKTFILQNQQIQISFLKFVVYDLSGKLFKFWIYVSQTCLTAWNQWKTAASQNVSACSISKNINDFILFHLCFNSSFLFLFTVPVFPPVIGKLSCWTHAPINHNCPYGFMWAVWGQKNGKLL